MYLMSLILICLALTRGIFADFAYITNYDGGNISIVDLTTNATVGYVDNGPFTLAQPFIVQFTPDQTKAYVLCNNGVFAIDPTQNLVTARVDDSLSLFFIPQGISYSLDSTTAYVTNLATSTVNVIDVASNTVTAIVNTNGNPFDLPIGIQVDPTTGMKAYVANYNSSMVSIIDLTQNPPIVTGYVGTNGNAFSSPYEIAFVDDTSAYVTNRGAAADASVSIINTTLDIVTGYVIPLNNNFSEVEHLFVSFDNSFLLVESDGTDQVSLVSTVSNTTQEYLNGVFNNPDCFHLTLDDDTAYVVNRGSNGISIVDLVRNLQTGTVDTSQFPLDSPSSIDISFKIQPVHIIPRFPPTNLQVDTTKKNVFAAQTDLINVFTWSPPPLLNDYHPVSYQVYRDAALTDLLATVSADQPLQFNDHNRRKGNTDTYYVVAVLANGEASLPATITVTRE